MKNESEWYFISDTCYVCAGISSALPNYHSDVPSVLCLLSTCLTLVCCFLRAHNTCHFSSVAHSVQFHVIGMRPMSFAFIRKLKTIHELCANFSGEYAFAVVLGIRLHYANYACYTCACHDTNEIDKLEWQLIYNVPSSNSTDSLGAVCVS